MGEDEERVKEKENSPHPGPLPRRGEGKIR
jgi:hypothetical protein